MVETRCPVDIQIFDPDGLVVNKQSSQIPNTIYSEEDRNEDGSPDDSIYFRERKQGTYKIWIIPELELIPTQLSL